VREELIPNDGFLFVAVQRVEHERLVRPVARRTEHQATVASQIERVSGEPVAAAFSGLEAIDRKPSALRRGPPRSRQCEPSAGQPEQTKLSKPFHKNEHRS